MKTNYLRLDSIRPYLLSLGAHCVVCDAYVGEASTIHHKYGCICCGDYLYIIPSWHEACRAIFTLNPLAYEGLRYDKIDEA